MSPAKLVSLPQIKGVGDKVLSFVSYGEKYVSAVTFVLGDTYLAADEKAALVASHVGFRSVTKTGDLFELGAELKADSTGRPLISLLSCQASQHLRILTKP